MIVALLLFLALQADPLEKELDDLLRRLDASELADREAAAGDLESFTRKVGPKASALLKKHADSANGEIRARVRGRLEFIARVDECRKTLSAFDAAELPDCRAATLAIYNTNRVWWSGETLGFSYDVGWVLRETNEEVELFGTTLGRVTRKRDRTLPEDWDLHKGKHPGDLPLPGEMRKVELGDFCKKLLGSVPRGDFDEFEDPSYGGLPRAVEPCLFAFWALQRGEEKLALDLVELSRKLLAEDDELKAKSVPDVLRECVATSLRSLALVRAQRGEPRAKLAERWRKLGEIEPANKAGESARMLRLYEELIAEDAQWKDPAAGDLPGIPAAARAAVWLHRLRDHAVGGEDQPWHSDIFDRSRPVEGAPNPASELVKLGWEALPAVIGRLEDPHPTRCLGLGRDSGSGSLCLLSVGECCQEIFEAIVGRIGEARASEAQARTWWASNKDLGAEKYYLRGLARKETIAFSSGKLLELDRDKHLPRLFDILARGERERRNELLPVLEAYAGKEHRPILESFLKDEDLFTVIRAARALWHRCGSETGALVVLDRVKSLPKPDEDGNVAHLETAQRALELFREVRSEALRDGVCALMASPVPCVRMQAMSSSAEIPSRRTAEALVSHLGDRTPTNWTSTYPIRFCDQAAEALIRMLGLSKEFKLKGKEDERDRTIGAFKAWWEKNRDSIDWAAHVRRAEEARDSKK